MAVYSLFITAGNPRLSISFPITGAVIYYS